MASRSVRSWRAVSIAVTVLALIAGTISILHTASAQASDPVACAAGTTIFGESAGGSSVCDQIASPTAAGLFERGVSTSGEYNTLLGAPTPLQAQDCKSALPSQAQADAAGASFAAAVGCGRHWRRGGSTG